MSLDGLLSRARNHRGRLRGYSGCLRCGDTWDWKTNHITHYTVVDDEVVATKGCFPLCEECWQALTPHERLPYYYDLSHTWVRMTPTGEIRGDWPAIRDAVLDGG